MHDCELINQCPFFNNQLKGDKEQIEILKQKYCQTNNLNCARYMIAMAVGKEHMPDNLFPHQKDQAYDVISKCG